MLNEKNNEFIMDIIKDLLEKERNTYNKQMALLKTEVIKHKELNKRLLRNKVKTSSFSDSMYENENINSINDQHQQQAAAGTAATTTVTTAAAAVEEAAAAAAAAAKTAAAAEATARTTAREAATTTTATTCRK